MVMGEHNAEVGGHKAYKGSDRGQQAAFAPEKRVFSGVTGDDHRQPDLDSEPREIDHKLPLVWLFKALAEFEDPSRLLHGDGKKASRESRDSKSRRLTVRSASRSKSAELTTNESICTVKHRTKCSGSQMWKLTNP